MVFHVNDGTHLKSHHGRYHQKAVPDSASYCQTLPSQKTKKPLESGAWITSNARACQLLPASKSLPRYRERFATAQLKRTGLHESWGGSIWRNPTNFNADGYLTLGFASHNPDIADWYTNNGSMYIASSGLLALGLPASDSYWTAPGLEWTQKKAYANKPFPKDYAVDY